MVGLGEALNMVNQLQIRDKSQYRGLKPCDFTPCINGGKCTNEGDGNFTCHCESGWTGETCQEKIAKGIEKSIIIGSNAAYLVQLSEWLKPVSQSNSHWILCWRGSKHGWAASTFHSLCDGKGPTVTIIKVNQYIFGGYASISWGSQSCYYRYDATAFLFSLRNKPGWAPTKLPQTGPHSSNRESIYDCNTYGPTFGAGHAIFISNLASSGTSSCSDIGWTYSPPAGHAYQSTFAQTFLAGTRYFRPTEVEVFYHTS
ncbi:sperm receptor for egg jelly-like [Montipora foliosa]|uniref:sperm receptor for egg jelly-like n=1 Tax=Montipora foliosa TaxID=591990 RepID=UPI0035F20AA1